MHSQGQQTFVERNSQSRGPAMLGDQRKPPLFDIPKQVSRSLAQVSHGEHVEGFHRFLLIAREAACRYTGAEEERREPMIPINDELAIPDEEVSFATSRSGGPGGQNVNKLETRVTVRFDVGVSPSLSEEQRQRLRERLATRITRAGVFHVTSQKHRTQAENKEAAVARFAELMAEALREEAPRKPTRVPKAARRRRLDEKRRQSQRKRDRSAGIPSD